jgi:hypothetical protein
MKTLTLLIIIIAFLIGTTNMAKLSKREQAAKKAGGTLNYKTGQVTVKSKSSSSSKSSSKPKYVLDNSGGLPVYKIAGDTSGEQERAQQKADYTTFETKHANDKPQKKSSSSGGNGYANMVSPQRVQASEAYNGGKAVLGASDSKVNRPSTIAMPTGNEKGQWYNSILEEAKGLIDQGGYNPYKGIKNLAEDVYTGFKSQGGILGAPKANAMDEEYFDDNLGQGANPYTPPSAMEELGFIFDNGEVIGYSPKTNQTNQSERTNQSRPNPKPTQNIFTQAQPFSQPQEPQQDNQSRVYQPDPSPVVTNQSTTRRFLGNGSPMSNGAFSNGKGYTGLEGATLGMDTQGEDSETNLINQLLGINTAQASEMPQQPMNAFQSLYNQNPIMQASQRINDQAYMSQNTSPAFRGDTTPRSTGGGYTGGSQGQGGGMAPQVNPAQAQYESAIKGYGSQARDTEKAYKRALASMLKGIEAEYAQSQTEGTETLGKSKEEDLLKLSGLFNFANQDPNSEQRMQYQQRTNNDYATQLTDLLSKLTASKNKDILSAKSGNQQQMNSALDQISSAKNSAKQNLAQLLYQMQNDQVSRQAKSYGGSPKVANTKLSHNDIFNYVQDAVSQGGSWQEIADQAKDNGVDTSTGSYIDQLLNRQFRG